ncbi:DEAD/DEAH box helicase [Actinocorallia longicatena]|uniref:DEAD/DEAH box helicase n=1 Tax=Actinocorallia longicatena TaxID=111803 RepID=A0ABP6QKI6_9ACTN
MLPFDPPHLLFPDSDGVPTWCLADGVTLTRPPLRRVGVAEALPGLLTAPGTDPSALFWAEAAAFALHLLARGGRPGPADEAHLAALAAAMPATARSLPLTVPDGARPGPAEGLRLPAARDLLAAFLDAVTDALTGRGARSRVSLRIEHRDGADFKAVVQIHDGALVQDLAAVWPRERDAAVAALRLAAQVYPPAGRTLDLAVPDEVYLTDKEAAALLNGGAAALAAAGVAVHWPKDLSREVTSRAAVRPGPLDFTAGGTVRLGWRLAIGGVPLTDAELDALAQAHRPVVRLRDQWVLLDAETLDRARRPELDPLTPVGALAAALAGTVRAGEADVPVDVEAGLAELRDRLADPERSGEVPPPPGLTATLRDYQLRGLAWLARMTDLGLGACLADDMGLGKTLTLIALHLHRLPEDAGPTLVVCPASLLGTWEREIRRFAPGQDVTRFHGTRRDLPGHGFVLTTYATMRLDADVLAAHRWGMVVADEAQAVKNRLSGTARELRRIPAAARVALTGTPVENNLGELWAVLDWTTPGLLGTLSGFRTRWARPIEAGDEETARRFAALFRPFLLRRRKDDPGIAPELPAKIESDAPVTLTAEQASLYAATVAEMMAAIRASDGMERRGAIVKLLTGLKQICNHPAQYLREHEPVLTGRSGKLDLLDDLVDQIVEGGGAVLVFTQYVAMARLLETHLAGRGVPTLFLHGGTPVAERERLVERFQEGRAPVFLLSLKAAGTGLTLTRADHVIHYDRWWNPAVEDQATDRAHRIGQTRPVQVHRLIAEGTVEDRIAALLTAKRGLADRVLTSGETALTELSDDDLAALVALEDTP